MKPSQQRAAQRQAEEAEQDRMERLREQADRIRATPVWPSYDDATEQALAEELMGKGPTAKRQAAKPKAETE